MRVDELFYLHQGNGFELYNMSQTDDSNISFVSRTAQANGVVGKVDQIDAVAPFPAGYITVALGGSVLSSFVQKDPFYTAFHIMVLEPKRDMTFQEKIFYCMCIQSNAYRYSYGRQANKTLRDIQVPDTVPEWVNKIDIIPITTKNKQTHAPKLSTELWREFVLDKVFTLKGGFYNKKPEHSLEGSFPFLGSTETNNGVTEYYSIKDIHQWDKIGNEDFTLDKKIFNGNCIAVTVNGSVCNAFYQKKDFTCSHDITALYLNGYTMNVHIAEFLCTIIMQDKYRWSYGRKPHNVKKFGKSIVKLPIMYNEDGSPIIDKTYQYSENGYVPDWEFMENYIKSLPYGDRI